MKKENPTLILEAMAKFPEGASLDEILGSLDTPLSRRTLQRRLSSLVEEGLVLTIGKARARKYQAVSRTPSSKSTKSDFLLLSSAAKQVLTLVTAPVQTRQHVNYNRKFLESYKPNSTYYLDKPTRKSLLEMGKSPNGNRPAGTYVRQIFNRLLIDLSWNSSRLEGNTYSLLETERLLEMNEPSEGKDIKEAQMILNHRAAIEFLVGSAEEIGVNRFTILNLHALLSNNLLRDPRACGRIRSIPVDITETVYIPAAVPQFIEECFGRLIDTAAAIQDPFEQAFFLMVHLPYLQPFEDVNKRVSRLAANVPLVRENLCPLSFVDVPKEIYISGLLGVYELNRLDLLREIFIWAYGRSCSLYAATKKSLGEPDPFRMRYQQPIKDTIRSIIQLKLNNRDAHSFVETKKIALPQADQEKFVEVVETELMGLHEGNIARYQLSLKEYQEWHRG